MAPQDTNPFLAPGASTDGVEEPTSGDTAQTTDSADTARTAETAPPVEPASSTPMNFGLLFQAPDPETRAPRREQAEPIDDADDSGDSDSDADSGTDQQPSNRSRRRGGRGRRKDDADKGEDNADEPKGKGGRKNAKKSDAKQTDDDSGDSADSGDSDQDDEQSDGSRRRTRRRRRSGATSEGDDPPGTVTKVREPRKDRDEVTAIKGSTRLEAKKQRRREGREAGRRRTVITEAEFLARRESVDRQMVVRERHGRTQIGVLEDGVLVEHYVSREVQQASMAGNVYLGKVQNVLPSMEAAFVDIGRGRNAVLYAGEVNWDAAGLENGQAKRIENALKSGDTVLVQVTKDPIGHKGARLTSQVSLPGRFLVYVPGNSMTGISRKLPDTERARLKKILKEVVPADAGVIVRTAAEGASEADLRADVERLQAQWEQIQADAKTAGAPSLLHGEPDLTVRVIRDVFNEDFSKLVVQGDGVWKQVEGYVTSVAPDLAERLEKWTGEQDVFTVHRIDEQLAKALDRKVWLPSGGSLIIDRTEAMTVIDVNTGKFVGSGGNLEETVTKNNLEAAEEIVRQLRLRDIGGIIVVDFIDMVLESNRDLVVRRLLECLGRDRTKHQVAEVTSLGLVQMTRKRVGSGLLEVFSEPCEHCGGRGIIVHTDPVDKPSGGGNGGGGNSGGNGKSRKGRGKKQQDERAVPSGPTAAQIAAAAHAAAVSADKHDQGTDGADGTDGTREHDATSDTIAAEAIDRPDLAVTGRAGSQRNAAQETDRAQAEQEAASEPDESAEQPAPKLTGRARRRRATAAAGSAPHVDTPAAPAPVTVTAAAAENSADAGHEPEPVQPVATTAAPKRKKRTRVVAPAGPPTGDDA
ncbi:Rne/Rng family ribonuclease [Flexivirga meconopsidis]|uniref:Rne/Rng family ribonuclease n=1 Tax=Flexivirga meconopsidis TaxID=2977121 RepID=UPI00223EB470|nr:Rne/Rng family ribonuclease [Flexivirga meconopsidis]